MDDPLCSVLVFFKQCENPRHHRRCRHGRRLPHDNVMFHNVWWWLPPLWSSMLLLILALYVSHDEDDDNEVGQNPFSD
jgi:hypothetical protein